MFHSYLKQCVVKGSLAILSFPCNESAATLRAARLSQLLVGVHHLILPDPPMMHQFLGYPFFQMHGICVQPLITEGCPVLHSQMHQLCSFISAYFSEKELVWLRVPWLSFLFHAMSQRQPSGLPGSPNSWSVCIT